ncbi:hypothetical protein FQN54_000058 [Arachnomyces sp. PD_36]|nr:hypothetical protein FQN54_000058 [Arachnomyces sp. PD_36]
MANMGASRSHPQHQKPAAGQQEFYRVFLPEFDTVAFDPLDPPKRYHTGVFVETEPAINEGTFFHVTGDIIAGGGMRYEEKDDFGPMTSNHLHRFQDTMIDWVIKADFHSGRISSILRALPRPTKQQGINFWEVDPVTGRHEII